MDTGSTLYKRLQASLERQKKAKRKEAAKKCKKTKTENQRKRNEAAGLGYHTDNEVKAYEKCSKRMKKRKKEIIDAWNKKHKILIYGYEVEMYVQDYRSPNASDGMAHLHPEL